MSEAPITIWTLYPPTKPRSKKCLPVIDPPDSSFQRARRSAEDAELEDWAARRGISTKGSNWQRRLLIDLGREVFGKPQRRIWNEQRLESLVSRIALQMVSGASRHPPPNIKAAIEYVFEKTPWKTGPTGLGMQPDKASKRYYEALSNEAVRSRLRDLCRDLRAGWVPQLPGMTPDVADKWASEIEAILSGERSRSRPRRKPARR